MLRLHEFTAEYCACVLQLSAFTKHDLKIILKHIAVTLNAYHIHNFRVTCIITCKTFIPFYFKPKGADRKYSTL